ncbi:hypothetical protein [Peptoniphilus sp. HMSC062D09]|uniref:hypothetical protein n=1 Tax=Peptoniphilus sp. HMSC062D09 TaxID=1739305 RepID=UPI0008A4913D|nr:hypothetical protein [Peptoniphilus sp. HMSC062D09]OFK81503.1 hypothetical protein HMPREF2801_05635 [Peptoniphilus sp. HMSC062D09]
MLKKKFYLVFYLAAIIFILFFTLNGNKFYTIKEKDIEIKNKISLEKENFNNYSLKLKEDINYNKLYVYKSKNDEFYIFIYSKSIFFDRYNLDDDFMTKDKSINRVASNYKYKNFINIDLEKDPLKIDVKSEKNEDRKNTLIKYLVVVIVIAFLGYRRNKRENFKK